MESILFRNFKRLREICAVGLLAMIFLGNVGAGSMKLGPEELEVTGKVYVMGNEPFTQVAIKLDDGQVYVLLGDKDKELRFLQGKRVSVVGRPGEEKPRGKMAIVVRSFKVLEQE